MYCNFKGEATTGKYNSELRSRRKVKTANFFLNLEERVLKQTGYIGVGTIHAPSLAGYIRIENVSPPTPHSPTAAFEMEVVSGPPSSPQTPTTVHPARGFYRKLKFSGFCGMRTTSKKSMDEHLRGGGPRQHFWEDQF